MTKKLSSFKKSYHVYFLGIILFTGFFLRFYNFPKRYGFDFDAARDSLVASLFSERLTFPLTGAASSAAPFNFGPWYYWGLIIFEKVIPLYGSWIFVSLVSLIIIIVVYKIGEKIENKNFGLILAGIFAISPSQIILSTTLSNPSIIPLFSGLVILFFIFFIKTRKMFHVFLMSLFLSIGISTHFQLVGFIIFPILIIVFYENRVRNIMLSALGFIVPLIPIFIFEINNNFYNSKGIVFFFTQSRDNVYVANRWLFYVRDFWPKFWSETLGLSLSISLLIISLLGFLFIIMAYKRLLKKTYLMVVFAFIFNFILLRYFPSQKPIYYLYYLQIFIFIFSGYLIFKIFEFKKIRPIGFFLLLSFSMMLFSKDLNIIRSESSNREIVRFHDDMVEKYPDSKFNIFDCDSDFSKEMGLVYLLYKNDLISKDGKKIALDNNCRSLNSIVNLTANDLKNMQVYKSY